MLRLLVNLLLLNMLQPLLHIEGQLMYLKRVFVFHDGLIEKYWQPNLNTQKPLLYSFYIQTS